MEQAKDKVEARVGQVWEINRGRYYRRAEVLAVHECDEDQPYALMMPDAGLTSKVSIRGLVNNWKLIKDI
jgi:hypothetical protein